MNESQQAEAAEANPGPVQPRLSRVLGQVERHVTRLLEAALAGERLTVDQWRVLDLLADREGHPMSEIAATIVVPGPTLTKIVDKLVDAALVYRLVDERDRRRVLAFLSERGHELHRRVSPRITGAEAAAVEGLGPDATPFLALLTRLAQDYAGVGGRA